MKDEVKEAVIDAIKKAGEMTINEITIIAAMANNHKITLTNDSDVSFKHPTIHTRDAVNLT